MSKFLNFPLRLERSAVKCLAVAANCDVPLEPVRCETAARLSLVVSPGTEVCGSGAVCHYLLERTGASSTCLAQVLQWASWVESEISPYPPNSQQMARSLAHLSSVLAGREFLLGSFGVADILVGFPLLSLPPQLFAPLASLAAWLAAVKEETQPFSAQVEAISSNAEQKKIKKPKQEKKSSNKTSTKLQESSNGKLKILCIHGYRQNAKTFREKLGSFRKLIGKRAELEFITAPHRIASNNPDEQEQFGWWFSQPNNTFDAHERTGCSTGWEESVAAVETALVAAAATGQPHHGILAFSQGASLVAHLAALQQAGQLGAEFKFCILVAGFLSRSAGHCEQFSRLGATGQQVHTAGQQPHQAGFYMFLRLRSPACTCSGRRTA